MAVAVLPSEAVTSTLGTWTVVVCFFGALVPLGLFVGADGVSPGVVCFAAVVTFRILQQALFPSSDTCLVSKLAYTGEPTRSPRSSAGSVTWN